jgi:hypothetical protein
MERTRNILKIFGCDTEDFEDFNFEEIIDFQPAPLDCWRIFRFFYGMENFSELSEKEQEELEKTEDIIDLDNCKLWRVEEDVKKMLELTKPSKNTKVNLPFPEMFFDVDLNFQGRRVFGIKIGDDINTISVLADFINWQKKQKEGMENLTDEEINKILPTGENIINIRYVVFDEKRKSALVPTLRFDLNELKLKGVKPKDKRILDEEKEIANFVANALLLLNEPRVVVYIQERENNERRIKRGKIPIPTALITKIEVGLKNYIEKVYFNGLSHSKLDYSYWVRGHWRMFSSPIFIHKQGQKIWIPPFIRGSGLLVPQVFEMVKARENN